MLLSLTACAGYMEPEIGSLAFKADRIPLEEVKGKESVFETKNLKLDYTLHITDGQYRYRGVVAFKRSLTDSFGTIVRFFFKMNFLDANGRVVGTVDVTPLFGVNTDLPPELKRKAEGMVPPGTTAIAFNYFGNFRGQAIEINDDWDIYYCPFE